MDCWSRRTGYEVEDKGNWGKLVSRIVGMVGPSAGPIMAT